MIVVKQVIMVFYKTSISLTEIPDNEPFIQLFVDRLISIRNRYPEFLIDSEKFPDNETIDENNARCHYLLWHMNLKCF